ncbi:MAG: glycoside hydrolase family 3 N-terminal domain-containing protein [Cellvibrio sp.]|uniref:glycoside hydrolase family 3 protein n=1 Tax=Cellvibrio sp. TaxID=1965322 RepID=UPI00271F42EC|nr:glycoside hydrolase family 3 N-terminal domain-containing protein [Cellvibrio sp.]
MPNFYKPGALAACSLVTVCLVVGAALSGCEKKSNETATADTETSKPAAEKSLWPRVQSAVKKDPAIEAKIAELLGKLSLEEKVGQLIQPELRQVTPADVTEYSLGSILNGGGSFPGENKHAKVEDWLALADGFYNASMSTEGGRVPVPIMWGTDAVHGHNNIIGATLFPHNIGLGATRNPELIKKIGAATAAEIAVTGIDWSFAPTLAVVRDDRWGRTYESYSEDPAVVKAYGGKMVEGLQGVAGADLLSERHVIATAKHFLADGGTEGGQDRGDAKISEEELVRIHNAGYETALAAGAQTVMASFSSWQDVKMHGHKYLLTDQLKTQMGFDGLVVGDWNGHAFVSGCTPVSCPQSINAGLDIFMAPDPNWKELYHNTLAQVKSGEIPMARLDDAVSRILRVKLRAGLFEKGAPSTRELAGKREVIGSPEHRAVARQAVRESVVLLKNNAQTLPVKANSKILVAGDGADNIGKQSGGWSITWQGTGNANTDFPGGSSIYQGIAEAVDAAGGAVELSANGSYKNKPDVAFVVFGEDPYAEMQGDVGALMYKNETSLALLKKLKADGIKVISLFITGRPLWANNFINASDAFAVVWLPGSEGVGIADVVLTKADGSVNFDMKGKLPFSWPASPAQSPLNHGDADYQPQFAYDFGLTYSDKIETGLLDETAAQAVAANTPDSAPIFNQRVLNPWTLVLLDHRNNMLPVTTSSGELGAVQVSSEDRQVQEDSRRLQFNGSAKATVTLGSTTRTDFTPYIESKGALVFDVKVNAKPDADVNLGMHCGSDCVGEIPVTEQFNAAAVGEWTSVSIALECFAKKRVKMDMVLAPFMLSTAGRLDVSIYNVRIEKNATAPVCAE